MDYKLIYQDRFTITGRGDCITINKMFHKVYINYFYYIYRIIK
jgi:hypothetical protein